MSQPASHLHDVIFTSYLVDREFLEPILDDGTLNFGLSVKRPPNERNFNDVRFQMLVPEDSRLGNPVNLGGGLLVISSVRPSILQAAMHAGLNWMLQSGQLRCADFYEDEAPSAE